MIGISLFVVAGAIASGAALLAVYSRTGEQETLAGVIGFVAFLFAAGGALARVSGY